MLMRQQKVEFSFVEFPQQDDFGIDGVLNIFVDNIYQHSNPICQVKGTMNDEDGIIQLSSKDLQDLQNKNTLSIVFGINNTLGDNSQVGYFFPQCENLKNKKVNNFPHFLENSEKSKIELWENIEKFEIERMNKIKQKQNSLDWQNDNKIKFINNFELNNLDYKTLSITHPSQESVEMKIELNFKNQTEAGNWGKDWEKFHTNQKDELQIKKELITNFEQVDGWEIGNTVSRLTIDGIFLGREILWEGEIMFKKSGKNLILNCQTWWSVEQNCLVLESGKFEGFHFRFYLNNQLDPNSQKINGKMKFNVNLKKLQDVVKIDEFYDFWESESENLEIWKKENLHFSFQCNTKPKSLITDLPQREFIKYFAVFKSFFKQELENNEIEIKMPHDYSEEDRIAIFSLGWLVSQFKSKLENFVIWENFEPKEFEKYMNNGKNILIGNSFRGNLPIKTVVFQNKKFNLYGQNCVTRNFDIAQKKVLFEVKKLLLEIQNL